MANLKNITDLPIAESAEGLNLIVNDNGSAKQISASSVSGGAVNLTSELEKLGFILYDEENDWYFEDDFNDEGEYRQTIPFNETSFKKFCNTVNNTVVYMFDTLNMGHIAEGDVFQCEFSHVFSGNGGIGVDVYNVEVGKAEDSDNLELYISLGSTFVGNS